MMDDPMKPAEEKTPAADDPVMFHSAEHGSWPVVKANGEPLLAGELGPKQKVNIQFDAGKQVFVSDFGMCRRQRRAVKAIHRRS